MLMCECSETNTSTAFEGVQQAIIAYLMEEEVLEVQRQRCRGGFGRSCWWHWACPGRGSMGERVTPMISRPFLLVLSSILLLNLGVFSIDTPFFSQPEKDLQTT